jgi:hypothetical protein
MGGGVTVRNFDFEPIKRNLRNLIAFKKQRTIRLAKDVSTEMDDWMKQNAPWYDVTGAARDSLSSKVVVDKNRILIVLYYDIDKLTQHPLNVRERDYSIHLEGYLNLGILVSAVEETKDRVTSGL